MDFSFTEEQSMLRDTVASYLADHYSFEQRHAALAKEPGWSPAIWKAFAEELGILGAPFPEDLGGLGGGPIENWTVARTYVEKAPHGYYAIRIAGNGDKNVPTSLSLTDLGLTGNVSIDRAAFDAGFTSSGLSGGEVRVAG